MAERPGNLVPGQLRLIRDALAPMQGEMRDRRRDLNEEIEDVTVKVNADTAILIDFRHYIHPIDERVEHLERMMDVNA